MTRYELIPSQFGELAVLCEADRTPPLVTQIWIPLPGRSVPLRLRDCPGAAPGHADGIDVLCAQIARFLAGEALELPVDLLDRDRCTPFQWKVLMAEWSIPRGEVRTYGQVAAQVGRGGGSRAVGNALARNPFPIVVPCHRTIRSDGSLGGYQGGAEMKRKLLEMEGVRFDRRGYVIQG